MDRERPKKTGLGGNCLRSDFAPLAGGRTGLIFSGAMGLDLSRLSRRGNSRRMSESSDSSQFHGRYCQVRRVLPGYEN